VRELLARAPTSLSELRASLGRLREETAGLAEVIAAHGGDDAVVVGQVAGGAGRPRRRRAGVDRPLDGAVTGSQEGMEPDLRARLDAVPTLAEVAALGHTLAPTPGQDELRVALALAASRASARIHELRTLAARASELADIDYEFLYDRGRHLLTIGYNVDANRLDASFYDLLASEARLASFVAIAQGKLPQEHWFRLGRSLTSRGGKPALLSWSGSMFEYLMPLLVMPTYRGTILDETYRGVVERQIEYGHERGVPWGVSESGYNKTDAQLNYQYRAFGVPGLGFKRGLADDLVIAPYACAMALMVAPAAATENLRRLAREGRLGPHGFYEAIDYTPARLPRGQESVTVASYMAHHQGMSFLALDYLLARPPDAAPLRRRPGVSRDRPAAAGADPAGAGDLPPSGGGLGGVPTRAATASTTCGCSTPSTPSPQVQLLSNGRYHVMVSNAGGGYSRWRDLAVTRWHEDPTRDGWGSACYLRDVETGSFWSVAHQPTLVTATRYEAIFSQGRAEFRRVDGTIETHVEISVSPEDDVELRRVSLTNRGDGPRTIELTSYAEVVLATAAPPTRPTRRSPTCSCRPSWSARGRRSCAPAARARAARRRRRCST
jgi:cyclic beta-1,2-glucan synthetase